MMHSSLAPSSSGPGRRPLKAEAAVRIRSGLLAGAHGYLARRASGSGPGVVVIQEWWGLSPSLQEMADRLAAGGFVALAPDLYHGEVAGHDEMDKAAHLMSTMPQNRAARDMSGAVD